ncbi:hypothetical protein MSPP1_001406 [Malassezia sp. CBS 17886]|nr:hypothetical protein MSPP1_001406 [Malassezia sp. CBS 17886]
MSMGPSADGHGRPLAPRYLDVCFPWESARPDRAVVVSDTPQEQTPASFDAGADARVYACNAYGGAPRSASGDVDHPASDNAACNLAYLAPAEPVGGSPVRRARNENSSTARSALDRAKSTQRTPQPRRPPTSLRSRASRFLQRVLPKHSTARSASLATPETPAAPTSSFSTKPRTNCIHTGAHEAAADTPAGNAAPSDTPCMARTAPAASRDRPAFGICGTMAQNSEQTRGFFRMPLSSFAARTEDTAEPAFFDAMPDLGTLRNAPSPYYDTESPPVHYMRARDLGSIPPPSTPSPRRRFAALFSKESAQAPTEHSRGNDSRTAASGLLSHEEPVPVDVHERRRAALLRTRRRSRSLGSFAAHGISRKAVLPALDAHASARQSSRDMSEQAQLSADTECTRNSESSASMFSQRTASTAPTTVATSGSGLSKPPSVRSIGERNLPSLPKRMAVSQFTPSTLPSHVPEDAADVGEQLGCATQRPETFFKRLTLGLDYFGGALGVDFERLGKTEPPRRDET